MPNNDHFNQAAKTWDENPGRVKFAQEIASQMQNVVKFNQEMTVLDYGCGTGIISLEICNLVKQVIGMDTSEQMLEVFGEKIKAKQNQNIELIKGEIIENHLIEDYQFDVILTSMTMHHVADIVNMLAKFKYLLKPNGTVLLADLDSEEGDFHSDDVEIKHRGFDREIIKEYLISLGFKHVEDLTAYTLHKKISDGREKEFTVFLIKAVSN